MVGDEDSEGSPPGGALWRFAAALYGKPGVREACLAAQDRFGADVDILLWAAWCGRRGRVLDDGNIAQAVAIAAPWRRVIEPLRAARRQAGSLGRAGWSSAILGLELEAEAAELADLEQLAVPAASGKPIKENILIYLRILPLGKDEVAEIAGIVSSAADL